MSHDLLMLRGDVAGGFNLAVGEPVFLQEAMGDLSRHYLKAPDLRYPPFAGTKGLIEVLQQYHRAEYEHFVVTVGAKQALVAALHALKQTMGTERVYTPAPYWPSYPTLAAAAGMQHRTVRSRPVAKDIIINTTPNNPDGSCSFRACDIWDAAYSSWVYGFYGLFDHETGIEDPCPAHKVAVYSAAKLFGLSGLRIGWLATNDPELARIAAEYVEKATSGVSTHDQYALEGVMTAVNQGLLRASFQDARASLQVNRDAFVGTLGNHVALAKGLNAGMFAWFKPKSVGLFKRALETANVKVVPGVACGGTASHYRMSLGHKPTYMLQALTALKNALENTHEL